MARPTWRGAISFGLVNVPVALYTAVRPQRLRFRQLHAETGNPVRQRRVDAETGKEVAYDELVKGYEVDDGTYVIVDPAELAALDPSGSRLIEIHDFVAQSAIDPVLYDRAYYLGPDGETAGKPYVLLTEAMQRADRVAIASFVMRGNEYLAAIRAVDGRLVLSTMHYSDEVADPSEAGPDLDELDVSLNDRELGMAESLIDSMTTEFCPPCYRNEHRARVEEFLQAKAQDGELSVTDPDKGGGEVVDLMAALERSLAQAGESGGGREDSSGDAGGSRRRRGSDGGSARRGSGGGGRARSGGASSGGDGARPLDDWTRDELYARAQQLDIPGRSSMSKGQLVAAIEEATDSAA